MQLEELKGKTILVTGSAKRIARSLVLGLMEYSPRFILHYRNSRNEVEDLLSLVRKYAKDSYAIRADFSREEDREALFSHVERESIDILINSASIFPDFDDWSHFTYENYRLIFDVNFFTPGYLIKKAFSVTGRGLVINFLDAGLKKNKTNDILYRISKVSLEKLTYILALELAPDIRVNAIAPGAILPPAKLDREGNIIEKMSKEEFLEKYSKRIPLGKTGDVSYILSAVKFLIENDFVTGAVIPVDGGENLQ